MRPSLLFVSVGVLVSAYPGIPSQYCLHRGLLLSANLACCQTGTSDLLYPIGQDKPLIYVDLFAERTENPLYSPWSYKPVCTEVLEDIGSGLCVYTDATFSDGRGISIFTTQRIAREVEGLLSLGDSMALNGVNTHSGLWHLQKLPGKGTAMLAKRDLQRGDLVTAYTPVLLAYIEKALSTQQREKFLRIAVDQLPQITRDSYFSLTTIYGDPSVIIQDIVKANAFEMQVGGQMHLSILPEPSRINHDCAPNSQYYLDPSLLTHYVHATRQISRNEEITVSYLNPFQPHASRQQYLRDAFYFNCSCSRCALGERSDEILAQITSLQQILGDWSPGSTATTEKAEQLIQVFTDFGLDGFLDLAYAYATLTYNALGDAKEAVKYATLAAEAVALKDGPAAADFKMWNELIDNPSGHWSWKWRSR